MSDYSDPAELIARLETMILRSGDDIRTRGDAIHAIRNLAAERDAALAAKPAAPTGEMVRVRLALVRPSEKSPWQLRSPGVIYKGGPPGWQFCEVEIEVSGRVEVSDADPR